MALLTCHRQGKRAALRTAVPMLVGLCLLLTVCVAALHAAAFADNEQRVALVIDNGAYSAAGVPKLRNLMSLAM